MKYLMMVCVDPADTVEPDSSGYTIEQWVEEMDGRGVRLLGDRLRPPADATTVRVRGGELGLTDGPFVETKEFMGGFDILECVGARGRDADQGHRRLGSCRGVRAGRFCARFGTMAARRGSDPAGTLADDDPRNRALDLLRRRAVEAAKLREVAAVAEVGASLRYSVCSR